MNIPRLCVWGISVLLYSSFWLWYTNLDGPLTDAEKQSLLSKLSARGVDDAQLSTLDRFMDQDAGDDFIVVNVLDLTEEPKTLPATGPGADANQIMAHYMEYMFPALLSRASHPVFIGDAIHRSIDVLGIEGAEIWDSVGLMRYRSRRDLLEIVSNPKFGERHDYKLAALTKTIAYPVEPTLYWGDLRLMLALILVIVVLVLDRPLSGRQS